MFGFILLSSLQYFISLKRLHGYMESSVLLSLSASCYILFTSRTMFDKVILIVISTAHHCNLAQLFHKNLTFDYILVFLCGFSLIMICIYTSAGYKYILLNVK